MNVWCVLPPRAWRTTVGWRAPGGKLSEYRLSKNGRARFDEATKRIYGEPDTTWSGRWTLIVVPPMRAAQRNEIREELVVARFWRDLRQCVRASRIRFAGPALRSAMRADLLSKVVAFDASLAGEDAPQRLVDLGWDLEDLGLRYERFVARFAVVRAEFQRHRDIDPGDLEPRDFEPRDCFLVRTLLIHEYRRLHLRDPLLPAQLLRSNWPGAQAAILCRDIYVRVFGPSETYLSRVAARLTGALPAADASVLQRFGGIGPLLQGLDDEA